MDTDVTPMLDIVIASGNPGKVLEFEHIFGLYRARGLRLRRADGPALDVEEVGASYLANARLKALAYSQQYNSLALADDSGLSVNALRGAPGLHTARFGGPGLSAMDRCDLLLQRLHGVPEAERSAHFYCTLYLARPGGAGLSARGFLYGQIAYQASGSGGFGYDPIFYLPALGCTVAELSDEAKNKLSHRSRAAANLLRIMRTVGAEWYTNGSYSQTPH